MNRFIAFIAIMVSATMVWAQSGEQTATTDSAAPAPFHQEGIASWYGAEFEGRPTASGERFDSRLLTAAHPTLPFGTILRVTNKQNGKSVAVRVNDRGPFVAARILDVSRAAAEQLDMIVTGTAPVIIETPTSQTETTTTVSETGSSAATEGAVTADDRVQVSTDAPPNVDARAKEIVVETTPQAPKVAARPALLTPKAPDANSGKYYRLQVGSYRIVRNATEAFDKLVKVGLVPAYERNGELYRVVLANVPANDVTRLAEMIGQAGFSEALVREER